MPDKAIFSLGVKGKDGLHGARRQKETITTSGPKRSQLFNKPKGKKKKKCKETSLSEGSSKIQEEKSLVNSESNKSMSERKVLVFLHKWCGGMK